jgi:hypothetical protein
MIESSNHIYFLTYLQTGEFEYPIGKTDLYYSISESQLTLVSKPQVGVPFIPRTDIYDITPELSGADVKVLITQFLTENISNLGYGYPWYVKSDLFTEEEFRSMVSKAESMIDNHKAKAKLNTSILTEVCEKYKLRPEPYNDSGTSWQAQCPSGRAHWIAISTENNTWGCGYCRKKGGIPELVEWMEEIRESKN